MTTRIALSGRPAGWPCSSRVSPLGTTLARRRHASTSRKTIRENDVVLLRQKGNDRTVPILSKPLRRGDRIKIERGVIATNDIIGKAVRDLVDTSKGVQYRIHEPTLAEYTDLSPRLVTPIYSQDTSLIVSLLDLHPSVPNSSGRGGQDKIEIFEAGTGHGALTLNLARAVHGADTAPPPLPNASAETTVEGESQAINESPDVTAQEEAYNAWRANRRAVIHTLDQSAAYSAHAQKTVKNFRQGMYFPNVDFHVGSVRGYISGRMSTSSQPFLDHAILDLPNTHLYFDIVGKGLKPNGSLVTWCPSITQINKCVTLVKEETMPFLLERVIEAGQGLSGGREWDVRVVRPRALSRVTPDLKSRGSEADINADADADAAESAVHSEEEVPIPEEPAVQDGGWEMVCRPKVGLRITGGGFIALWRKMER